MTRGTVGAVAGVAAVVAVAVGAVWALGSDSSGTSTSSSSSTTARLTAAQAAERADAQAWEAKAADAFKPLVNDVQTLATGAREYLAGQRQADQFRAEVDTDLNAFRASQTAVAALPPLGRAPDALHLYVESARLYVDVARTYATLVRLPPGTSPDARTQLDFLGRRIRTLADRVYDRGRALITPLLHEPPSPDVDIRLPEEVPDWSAEGVPPGPPLEPQSPPTSADVQLRQADRATERRSAWVAAVHAAGIPAAASTDVAALARADIAAAEELRTEPDPSGPDGREASARLRLDLLVYADGHRAEQLTAILGPSAAPDLPDIGRDLLSIADELWPGGDLGPRPEGRG